MNRYKVLITFVTALCLLIPALLFAQVDTAWVRTYNGPANGVDGGRAIAVDEQGNVYVTGISFGTYMDYATIKYNSAGVQQWAQRYNGPGNAWDWVKAIAVDGQGNVYVTGGVAAGGYDDYGTIKYNSAGDTLWVRLYNGPGNYGDGASALAVDGQGNVYVTGGSNGSGTSLDYATIKYNSNGDTLWVRRYNGPGNGDDEDNSLAIDGQGNVYVTGESYGSGTAYDYATVKYNSAGVQEWVQRYNGPGNGDDWAYSLAVDGSGNVYVTGYSTGTNADYATIKYNSAGVQEWIQRYNGPGNDYDEAAALAVDDSGNVYVTGYCAVSSTNADFATIKYVQTSGVEENRLPLSADRLSLELYPNPAKTYFTIRLPQAAERTEIKIFDATGKIVKSEELKGKNNRVLLDGIKNGIYFVKVGNEMIREKLVITK